MLNNRNIVIKREGNKLLLPTINRIEIDAPANISAKTFSMCRIVDYNSNSGTIHLKLLPDIVDDRAFQIAIEENSDLLSSHNIKGVIFIKSPTRYANWEMPPINRDDLERANTRYQERIRQKELAESKVEEEKISLKQIATLSFLLPVKELNFSDGKVSFEHYVGLIGQKIVFDINNSFIKKEHDSIKNYFPKVLKVNKFSISIQLVL